MKIIGAIIVLSFLRSGNMPYRYDATCSGMFAKRNARGEIGWACYRYGNTNAIRIVPAF